MKIKDVRCEIYLQELPQPPLPRGGLRDFPQPTGKTPFTILKIITDDGIEGFGFGDKSIDERAISVIKQTIIDRDPFDREWIWQRLWYLHDYGRPGMPISLLSLSAVDVALWDIAGKALGIPIYKLMGAYRDKISIYASSWCLPTPQDYANEALSCKQQGITAYKIHPYWGIGEKDIEACRAVRQAVGDDMTLMLDPAGRYTREEALRVGKVLEELNFYWFEMPIPDHDIEGLIRLREKLDVPILAPEIVLRSMYSIPEYLLRGATTMVRCDTMISGGITPCKKIADMSNAFGMQCEIHNGGLPNLHVECAIKNCEFYEMFWPEESGPQRIVPLKEYPVLDNEGYLHVPQKPGLGIDIDWEKLGPPTATY